MQNLKKMMVRWGVWGVLGAVGHPFHGHSVGWAAQLNERPRKPAMYKTMEFPEVCQAFEKAFRVDAKDDYQRFSNLLSHSALTTKDLFQPLVSLKWETTNNTAGDLELYSISSLEILSFQCDPAVALEATFRLTGQREGATVTTEYMLVILPQKDFSIIGNIPSYPGFITVKEPQTLEAWDLLGMGTYTTVVGLSPYLTLDNDNTIFQIIIPSSPPKEGQLNNNFEGEHLGLSCMQALDDYQLGLKPNASPPLQRLLAIKDTVLTFTRPPSDPRPLPQTRRKKRSRARRNPPVLMVERLTTVNLLYVLKNKEGKKEEREWKPNFHHAWALFEAGGAEGDEGTQGGQEAP